MRGFDLFSNLDDLSRLHRSVTGVAVVAAWGSALLLVLISLLTGMDNFLLEATGPSIAAIVFTFLKVTGRQNAVTVFVTATTTVTVTYGLVGNETTLIPAMVSLVLIAVLGTLFVERHQILYVAAGSLWMLLTPLIWRLTAWTSIGLTMSVSFAVGSVILLAVRQSAAQTNHRYQQTFELAPIGLMEQDWTTAVRMLGVMSGETPEALKSRLERDPEFVRLIISNVIVSRANTEVGAIAGVPPSALVHTAGLSDVLPADTEHWIDQIVAVVHGDEGYYAEHPTRRYTGEQIHVGIRSISVERRPDSVRRLVAIDDITEQRLAEEAAAELVRAKDQFIASVSHELRTPLAAVVGFAAELSAGSMTDGERLEISSVIHEQATEMSYIVEDLLVAARADAGSITVQPEVIDVSEIAHSVRDRYATTQIEIVPHGGSFAFADPVRVRQILRNLISNAERYGAPPVSIMITGEERIVVEIHDRGPELSPEDRDRIFQPYARAHADRKGVTASVGLGLAVSHQLAGLMGGSLSYHYDSGSVFRLELPAADAENNGAPLNAAAMVH